ncbi:hypothetical protein [Mucilaginibacter psychrotolerans]|uniref:Uncharacterized protein n=1 Tax=Mucilaginibacter psychrotolerans TaxID=1524096 RepID=A0A4Y8SMJ6_9SPHI|nr:hypothetical protein [Mucilaginibacter psychrotolerans]TFF40122.1 hypothetical protein E2R66_02390 [Mucilaginibacter psychrotolerans]
MVTLEDIYKDDPIEKGIDEDAGLGAEAMLKAGIPIFYRDEQYPETLKGNLFIKEFSIGTKHLVRMELTADYRLLEEVVVILKEVDVSGWSNEQLLKAGHPITYSDEQYPETMMGELFVREYKTGAKSIVRRFISEDGRALEEKIRSLTTL